MNNESVGKKIVEALKKQAESMDIEETVDTSLFEEPIAETLEEEETISLEKVDGQWLIVKIK